MVGIAVLTLILACLCLYGVWEYGNHKAILNRIPIRIHVNGTRGKSSVTRLIASGLREGGITVLAKTTGTTPRIIAPDGKEFSVYRRGEANILEQSKILKMAAEENVRAVVLECMALHPANQWISESRLVQATHGVLTNVGEDHLDVMGPGKRGVALALGGSIPPGRKLFSAETELSELIKNICSDRSTELISLEKEDIDSVSKEDLMGFSYLEHKENIILALKVCESIGVDRATALKGMKKAEPDPGATTAHKMDFFGKRIYFVNGFAANDPAATRRIWEKAVAAFPSVERRIAIVHCRADRPDRSLQLGREVGRWSQRSPDSFLVVGEGTHIFLKGAEETGVPLSKMHIAESATQSEVFERAVDFPERSALIVGIGNIGGLGLDLLKAFKNRSERIGSDSWIY